MCFVPAIDLQNTDGLTDVFLMLFSTLNLMLNYEMCVLENEAQYKL